MNPYALVILAALLIEYAVELVADVLNVRALREELPLELEGVYDAERYRRSQEYTRVRTRFGLVTASFDLALFLAFWQLGGFRWLEGFAAGFGAGSTVTGLVFIGTLYVGLKLLHLPFRLYSTFVIEERFGFNRTAATTFWTDLAKGLALAAVIGGPVLALVLYLLGNAGELAWLWCWIAVTAILLAVQYVAPTWILPLFHRFEPLEEGELRDGILAYAESVEFPLDDVYVIDGSRRSTKANAFFTGVGNHKRVALYDTLVEKQSTPEMVAVLAHEVGHYKRGHIQKGLVLGIAQTGVVFWLLSLFLTSRGLHDAFHMSDVTIHAGLIFFALLYAPIDLALSVGMQAFSRRNEYEADAFSAETTGDPGSLASALRKLASENLSNLTPHPFHVFLHASHPPVLRRIRAIQV